MSIDWYKDFFQGVVLDVWREACQPDQTESEVDIFVHLTALHDGDRILDVPCGLGRHSLELAKRGYKVSGVDLSTEAVAEVKAQAELNHVQIEVLQRDMRDLPWEQEFHAACCLGNSFGYLEHAGTAAFLKAVSRALKPFGRLLIDSLMVAESILPGLDERNWMQVGDILMLIENEYRIPESRLETTYTFVRGADRETRVSYHYIYTVAEITRMLKESGLEVKAFFDSFSLDPYHYGSPRLVLLAEKTPP